MTKDVCIRTVVCNPFKRCMTEDEEVLQHNRLVIHSMESSVIVEANLMMVVIPKNNVNLAVQLRKDLKHILSLSKAEVTKMMHNVILSDD